MKKILVLSIGLLFSSVQAQAYSEAEVPHVAAELMQNPALIEKCVQLSAQGLTPEQVLAQLLESEDKQAHSIFSSWKLAVLLAGLGLVGLCAAQNISLPDSVIDVMTQVMPEVLTGETQMIGYFNDAESVGLLCACEDFVCFCTSIF
ncbi:hypothetical protein IPF37_02805 [bacterium]|nr:MAG: hypothetical protein IPF37_02805 [bacterium]